MDAAVSEVEVETRDAVGIVILNRPDRLNAVTPELGRVLSDAFLALQADSGVRAVVLTGAGRAFCAGADIRGGGPMDPERTIRDAWNPLVEVMHGLVVPIVAAVNGVAAGAGVSLALAADLRVGSPSTRFQLSFAKIGLIPDAGATWTLPRIVGLGRANELAMLARDIGGTEAKEWGLLNELVEDGAVLEGALDMARRLAGLSSSIGDVKRAHHHALDATLGEQLDFEASLQGHRGRQPDLAEAVAAFTEKRRARFAPRPSV